MSRVPGSWFLYNRFMPTPRRTAAVVAAKTAAEISRRLRFGVARRCLGCSPSGSIRGL